MPYAYFFAYSLLLLTPNILLFIPQHGISNIEILGQAQPLFPALLLYAFVIAAIGQLKWVTWVFLPFLLLSPIEAFYISQYHAASSAHIIATISESDPQEVKSFISGGFFIFIFIFITNAFIGILLTIKLTSHQLRWQHRSRYWILVSFSALFILLISNFGDIEDKTYIEPDAYNFEINAPPFAISLLHDTWPFGLPLRFREYIQENANLEESYRRLDSFKFNARQVPNRPGKQVFVLVIGETSQRGHWQLNGYNRATNPLLSKTENIISFSDMLSPSSGTRTAVPIILTRKPAARALNFSFNEKSIISAFKEAGFSTYWLSTQVPLGLHDTMVSVYAKEADHIGFYNLSDYHHKGSFDSILLAPLEKILAKKEEKQFIILHTLGSHFDYASRYPDEFDIFKPSLKSVKNPSLHDYSQRTELRNSYDNSIIFTDYVLSKSINLLSKYAPYSFLFYTSDHGEDVYDGKCMSSGHGRNSRTNYEIAALSWTSDLYKINNMQKVNALNKNSYKPISTEVIFPTLTDAANIIIDNAQEKRSLMLNEISTPQRIVFTPSPVNYDSANFMSDCQVVIEGSR